VGVAAGQGRRGEGRRPASGDHRTAAASWFGEPSRSAGW